jgi:hypothetical protein
LNTRFAAMAAVAICLSAPATAATPREILTAAAFSAPSRPAALAQVESALAGANAALARNPNDNEARLQQAIAIGYRAKLKKGLADAKEARRLMEALVAADPRNAEAHAALAGWHMDAVAQLGGFMARTMLGAKRDIGLAEIDKALRLGGNRALFPAMAALTRIQTDKGDVATARALAQTASTAATPTQLDRVMQRAAAALLVPLRQGDGKAAQTMAGRLLPFGRLN